MGCGCGGSVRAGQSGSQQAQQQHENPSGIGRVWNGPEPTKPQPKTK